MSGSSSGSSGTNNDVASAPVDYRKFFVEFFKAKGATEILIISIFFAFGIGSTIGLVRLLDQSRRPSRDLFPL
jgi:hypothetical protein